MFKIYICAPLAPNPQGDIKHNCERAEKAAKMVMKEWENMHKDGNLPLIIVPHKVMMGLGFNYEGEINRKWGMECCMELITMCSKVIVLGDNITMGMRTEIDYALVHGVEIEYKVYSE